MQENDNDFEFSFKPITDGLGFHQDNKNKKAIPSTNELKHRAAALAESLERAQRKLESKSAQTTAIDRGDLTPFYQKQETQEEKSLEKQLSIKTDVLVETTKKETLFGIRLTAWLLDFFLVCFLFLATVSLIFISAFNNVASMIEFVISEQIYFNLAPVFIFYYFFYFSFLEKTQFSTIGKSIFNLQVVSENEKGLRLYQTFFRSFISFVSLFTFGLGALLDFQGKLTNTKVIKNAI